MKERIVIEGKEPKEVIRKLVKASSIKMYEELQKEDRICIYGEELKREKIPENFEEVKQLVKEHIELLGLNKDVWEIDIQKDFIDIQKKYVTYRVRFTSIGNILFDAYLKIAENKTPNELWLGIKSLIGEE